MLVPYERVLQYYGYQNGKIFRVRCFGNRILHNRYDSSSFANTSFRDILCVELHHPVKSSSFNIKCVTRNNLPKPEVKCELHVREGPPPGAQKMRDPGN